MPNPRGTNAQPPRPEADAAPRHTSGTLAGPAAPTWVGAYEAGSVEAAEAELARRLGHLRATLTRFVRARRDAGSPVTRVLDELQALVRIATVREAWTDRDDALLGEAVRWTLAAYDDGAVPPHSPRVS
jgi:hypothetical protein